MCESRKFKAKKIRNGASAQGVLYPLVTTGSDPNVTIFEKHLVIWEINVTFASIMTKILCLMKVKSILIFLLLLPVITSAREVELDGLYYSICEEYKTAGVVGTVKMTLGGNVTIPGTIIYNHESYTVTTIEHEAFLGRSGLIMIDIPNTITTIGNFAFGGCLDLTTVDIPNSVISIGEGAFSGCSGMTSLSLGNEVTNIADRAFNGCVMIKTVTIPNSVKTIGNEAFANCIGMTSILLGDGLTTIGEQAFERCTLIKSIIIPNGVETIGKRAFSGCKGLTSIAVSPDNITLDCRENCNAIIESETNKLILGCSNTTIPNSVTCIGDYAFYMCTGLTSIQIPASVKSIGEYAFYGCCELSAFEIPNGIREIKNCTFQRCSNLESIILPKSISTIGDSSFEGCIRLASLDIPSSVSTIGDSSFHGCVRITSLTIPSSVSSIGKGAFASCIGLTSIEIPSSVTSIGSNAFSGCFNLKSVKIDCNSIGSYFSGITSIQKVELGNNVAEIGEKAFENCSGITNLSLGSNIEVINDFAFYACQSLTSVVIPNRVKSIGKYAFSGCTLLASIVIPNSVFEVGSAAFDKTLWYNQKQDGVVYAGNNVYRYKGTMPDNEMITIKDGTVSISELAFYFGCTSLESISIPSSMMSIGDKAFSSDNIHIICQGNNPPTLKQNSFKSIAYENSKVYIPFSAVKAYQLSTWNNFLSLLILGDTNGDKVINVADIVEISNYIKGNPSERFIKTAADVNFDGEVTNDDYRNMVEIILGSE